ncbi:MAG: adenylosuccinate lyase, partial [Acidimicrobiales bacterium]
MIPRYSRPEMAALFTDEARFGRWIEIEVLALEAWAALGVVPAGAARAVRERAPAATPEFAAAVAEREKVTDHDVAAFVDVLQQAIGGPEAEWVHYGLTSSDVVDTAQCSALAAAAGLLVDAAGALVEVLRRRAGEFRATAMAGRTHGIHAEPTTFGAKLALWCLQVDRDRTRLRRAGEAVAVGKLSGAVGTYSNVEPAVEAHVCAALGLTPVPASQVVARDRHAEYLWACASVGATVELIATEIRHLQRTEVAEVAEPFGAGQKGSSAMPHKRNPVKSEQLSGLARLLRAYLGAGLENVALWHERDISHSSVERVALPDASLLAYHLLRGAAILVGGLVVDPARMAENLEGSLGLVFSQPVLLALVAAGLPRDHAYRAVQRAAGAAWESRKPFRLVIEA